MKPPDLNQARVNKCLIALVNRKIVRKDNSTVRLISLAICFWLRLIITFIGHCIIPLASAMTSKPNSHAVEHTRRVFVEFPYNVLRSRMSGYPESRQRTNLRHHSGVMSYGVSVRHSPL